MEYRNTIATDSQILNTINTNYIAAQFGIQNTVATDSQIEIQLKTNYHRKNQAVSNRKKKLLPIPISLSTPIFPPWASMNSLLMVNPKPVPVLLLPGI